MNNWTIMPNFPKRLRYNKDNFIPNIPDSQEAIMYSSLNSLSPCIIIPLTPFTP